MLFLVNFSCIILHIAAVLITGGVQVAWGTPAVELFLLSSNTSCSLPSLPAERSEHIATDGGLLCGGAEFTSDTTCVQWTPDTGSWEYLDLTLNPYRYSLVSWTPVNGSGTYLMGGFKWKTAVLIKPDGTQDQEPGFRLKYRTE